jgi:hypothetical protein
MRRNRAAAQPCKTQVTIDNPDHRFVLRRDIATRLQDNRASAMAKLDGHGMSRYWISLQEKKKRPREPGRVIVVMANS